MAGWPPWREWLRPRWRSSSVNSPRSAARQSPAARSASASVGGAGGGSGAGAGGGGGLGDKYLGQVVSLIKSNLVYAGSKPEGAKAKIKVSLLPDGTIRDAQLLKAVGDPAYAEAARRAVITTAKFPARPGGKLFSGGDREWTLSFCAKETAVCTVD